MPGLLEEFYSEDLNQYYYADEDGLYYDDEEEGDFYYVDDNEGDFYYVDDTQEEFYYVDDQNEGDFYYVDDDEEVMYYQDEILYYEEEEPAMYFKKEINIAPQTVNTQRDAQGTSWDAASYEIDKEINQIAEEEGVDYSTAYRMFGTRYEAFDPDLSEYM